MVELLSLDYMKDTKSLLLALLSLGLVGTWVYHLYDKTKYSREISSSSAKDAIELAGNIHDSLQQTFTSVIQQLDTGILSHNDSYDSTNNNDHISIKFEEINKLKNEISSILNNAGATGTELELAQQKIKLLRQNANELRNDSAILEVEKKRMTTNLEQMYSEIAEVEKNVKKLDSENKELAGKINSVSTFTAAKLQLRAISSAGTLEKETSEARKTDKFALSFVVENKIIQYNNAEVYVVIIKPDGQVLQSQQIWESGSFNIPNGSKKNYSLKMRFEYNKGEPKPLLLTLNAENYQKGNYRMQVYHNGKLIGQTTKKLS